MSASDDEAALRARADAAVAEARRTPSAATHRAAAYALDRLGDEHAAIRHYDAAWALGPASFATPLDERRFLVGYGSTLRNVGRADDAVALLADAVACHPA